MNKVVYLLIVILLISNGIVSGKIINENFLITICIDDDPTEKIEQAVKNYCIKNKLGKFIELKNVVEGKIYNGYWGDMRSTIPCSLIVLKDYDINFVCEGN